MLYDDEDDDRQLPPPSAQPALQTAHPAAVSSRNDTPISLLSISHASSTTAEATPAPNRPSSRIPAADHRPIQPHQEHVASSSQSMNPTAARTGVSKPTSTAPPLLLPSGVATAPRTVFDPWNSASTGHQRAENRLSGSTSWRESRTLKLAEQYQGGLGGGKRVGDTVGAGSEEFEKDRRKANGGWERGAKGLRIVGQKSLAEVWGKSKASVTATRSSQEEELVHSDVPGPGAISDEVATKDKDPKRDVDDEPHHLEKPPEKQLFRGLCFYINGSTMPHISDHKLKYLLNSHGASQSIVLSRRSVTHVILGATCGGGLTGSKIQKEIAKTRGNAIKYVTVEWVVESVKATKRLPESRFSPLKLAPSGQKSVFDIIVSSTPASAPARAPISSAFQPPG